MRAAIILSTNKGQSIKAVGTEIKGNFFLTFFKFYCKILRKRAFTMTILHDNL